MKTGISPSVMCADLLNLERDIKALEEGGAAYLHFDIMDGQFVPNFCLGPDLLKAVRGITGIPADIHLMVDKPERHLELFQIRPGDVVSVHAESTVHLQRVLAAIRELGGLASLALNPATPLSFLEEAMQDVDMVLVMSVNPGFAGQKLVPSSLDKITRARQMLDAAGRHDVPIEVDGNVSFENAKLMRKAGAEIFVAGTSSVFKKGESIVENMKKLAEITA